MIRIIFSLLFIAGVLVLETKSVYSESNIQEENAEVNEASNTVKAMAYADYYIAALALQIKALRGYIASDYKNQKLRVEASDVLANIPSSITELMTMKNELENVELKDEHLKEELSAIQAIGHNALIENNKTILSVYINPGSTMEVDTAAISSKSKKAQELTEEECGKALDARINCGFYHVNDEPLQSDIDLATLYCEIAGIAAAVSRQFNPHVYQDLSGYMETSEILCGKKLTD